MQKYTKYSKYNTHYFHINKSLFIFHLFNCFRNMNLHKYPNVLSFITKLYIHNKYQKIGYKIKMNNLSFFL